MADVAAEDDEACYADTVNGAEILAPVGLVQTFLGIGIAHKIRVMTFRTPKMLVAQREYLLWAMTPGIC